MLEFPTVFPYKIDSQKSVVPHFFSLEVTNQLCAYHMSKKAYNTNLCVYLRCDRIYVDINVSYVMEFLA